MSAGWAAVIVAIIIPVVGWVLWAINNKKQTREKKKERLRRARPSFEDRSIKNPLNREERSTPRAHMNW